MTTATVRNTKNGKFQAVITNSSFGFEKVFTFATEAEALAKIEAEKQESQNKLSKIPTISDYFKVGA
jgi:hypothetical protein